MRQVMYGPEARLLDAARTILEEDSLLAALLRDGEALPTLVIESIVTESWASATYTGYLHRFGLYLRTAPADLDAARSAIEERLCSAKFEVPGYLVAQVALTAACVVSIGGEEAFAITIEASTVANEHARCA
jgi:hypothetical protein